VTRNHVSPCGSGGSNPPLSATSLEVPCGHLVVRVRPGFKQWRCDTGACYADNNTNPVGGYINFATLSGHYVSPLVYAATTLIARAFDAGWLGFSLVGEDQESTK
jgi:hypothetical protein